MERINICSINNNLYYIARDDDLPNQYLLWKNRESIAAIVPVEYKNYKEGHRVKHIQIPYSNAHILNEYDKIALEDAIEFLDSECAKLNFDDATSDSEQ